jgi:phosphatidylglycerophosphate synthase
MAESLYQPADRRPIAARHWRVSQVLAGWLAQRGVSPNAISLAGMGCGILAGAVLAATAYAQGWERAAWLAGAGLTLLRLLANMLDGMVATQSGRASAVGGLYNEVPDRVSDAVTLIGAGYALGGDVVLGYVAACVAVFTAYIRALGKAAGAAQEFCGPLAKQQRMMVVILIAVYCGLTPIGWQPTWGDPPGRGLMAAGLLVVGIGGLLTACRRLARIAANLKRGYP